MALTVDVKDAGDLALPACRDCIYFKGAEAYAGPLFYEFGRCTHAPKTRRDLVSGHEERDTPYADHQREWGTCGRSGKFFEAGPTAFPPSPIRWWEFWRWIP